MSRKCFCLSDEQQVALIEPQDPHLQNHEGVVRDPRVANLASRPRYDDLEFVASRSRRPSRRASSRLHTADARCRSNAFPGGWWNAFQFRVKSTTLQCNASQSRATRVKRVTPTRTTARLSALQTAAGAVSAPDCFGYRRPAPGRRGSPVSARPNSDTMAERIAAKITQ
jgi:hypothetical protein